jgi:hypothetical protein
MPYRSGRKAASKVRSGFCESRIVCRSVASQLLVLLIRQRDHREPSLTNEW